MTARRPSLPWYAPASLGALATVLLVVGLVLGLGGGFGERVGPPPARATASMPAPRTGPFRIVAIGDSITAGTGDARAGGYAARLARMLTERGHKAVVVNRAVPGAETRNVLERVAESDVRAELAGASLIVVSAAGNDLMHAIRPNPDRAPIDLELVAPRVRTNLHALIETLRAANPTAPIRLIGLYNPFDVLPAEQPAARAQLQTWNDLIEEASHADHDTLAVPIADLFYLRPDRLAADHYHPGPTGHELIAARVLETLPE